MERKSERVEGNGAGTSAQEERLLQGARDYLDESVKGDDTLAHLLRRFSLDFFAECMPPPSDVGAARERGWIESELCWTTFFASTLREALRLVPAAWDTRGNGPDSPGHENGLREYLFRELTPYHFRRFEDDVAEFRVFIDRQETPLSSQIGALSGKLSILHDEVVTLAAFKSLTPCCWRTLEPLVCDTGDTLPAAADSKETQTFDFWYSQKTIFELIATLDGERLRAFDNVVFETREARRRGRPPTPGGPKGYAPTAARLSAAVRIVEILRGGTSLEELLDRYSDNSEEFKKELGPAEASFFLGGERKSLTRWARFNNVTLGQLVDMGGEEWERKKPTLK